MPYANNRGLRIKYQVYGSGQPLVLIHGWSGEGPYWDECGHISLLSEHFRLVVPDLRGHGDSDTPGDWDFSDQAYASDVVAVLDDAKIDAAHVFGYLGSAQK